MSSYDAVAPPTYASALEPSRASGMTSVRSRSSVSAVSSDCGELVRMTGTWAVSPASLTSGGATVATPGSSAMAAGHLVRGLRVVRLVDGDEQRPVEARAEALGQQVVGLAGRGVLRVGAGVGRAEPLVGSRQGQQEHDRERAHGEALGVPRDEAAPAVEGTGAPARRPSSSGGSGSRPQSTRCPMTASSAGSSVTAVTTAPTTVIAAPRPSLVTNGMPTTARPEIETATVSPAKRTARPAVLVAVTAACFGVSPSARAERNRVRMNSA